MRVIRTNVREIAPPPGENPMFWDILVWPDGVYTNPDGRLMVSACNGTLELMTHPFEGHRSLNGVLVEEDNGQNLIYYGHNSTETLSPVRPSDDGKSHIYYRWLDRAEQGTRFVDLLKGVECLPILDTKDQEHVTKYRGHCLLVNIDQEWKDVC